MMTGTLRIALILVSVGTLFLMMRRIRQSKMQIESAVFWIVLALVLVVFSIFPAVADFAAHCLGIYSTANFLFLFAIFVLIVKVFYMTIHISQLEMKIRELVQQMALDEKKNREEKELLKELLAEKAETGEMQTQGQAGNALLKGLYAEKADEGRMQSQAGKAQSEGLPVGRTDAARTPNQTGNAQREEPAAEKTDAGRTGDDGAQAAHFSANDSGRRDG